MLNINKSLIALIQHNCVRYREDRVKETTYSSSRSIPTNFPISVVIYEAVLSQITQRIRFPKYLAHAIDRFGKTVYPHHSFLSHIPKGEMLVHEFISNGCLSQEDVIKKCLAVTTKILGYSNPNFEQKEIEKLTKVFQIMTQAGYLTLATTFMPVDDMDLETNTTTTTVTSTTPVKEKEKPKKKKRKTSTKKSKKKRGNEEEEEEEEEEEAEESVVAAAPPPMIDRVRNFIEKSKERIIFNS